MDAATVVRLVARHCAPLPVVEHCLMASWAAARTGVEFDVTPLTVIYEGITATQNGAGRLRLRGTAHGVAWAAESGQALVAVDTGWSTLVARVDLREASILRRSNLAYEPRCSVTLDAVVGSSDVMEHAPLTASELRMRGALGRSIQIVGALERVLELTVEHCRSRYQFGKPIGAFQMVQNHLAIIARDVQVARAAVERAIEAADDGGDPEAAVAVAKIVTSRAAAQAAARAHQVHGAIGATSEYPLQLATRRLLAWRMEHGSDAWWSRRLGELCGASDSLWTFITAQDGHVTR